MTSFRDHHGISAIWLALAWSTLSTGSIHAQWVENGVVLCDLPNNQGSPALCPDGSGGAIVCWVDLRNDTGDIFVQRIGANGVPQWSANGVALCAAPGQQHSPVIVADGSGGAIVAWADERAGVLSDDVYAQSVSSTGAVEWIANGLAICTAANSQYEPTITADNNGGAIVVWVDERAGSTSRDIYGQRVDSNGMVQWQAEGLPLCLAAGNQADPSVTFDGMGGVIAAWTDLRNGNLDIYAQRVSEFGVAAWVVNGVPICIVTREQRRPRLTTDGAGGAIVAWVDWRFEIESDVYAQRVAADGSLLWAAGGVALCSTFADQGGADIVSDGMGGAIVVWHDWGGNGLDIFAQRISASGLTLWVPDGVPVCDRSGTQFWPAIVSDGDNGAIVAWEDATQGQNNSDVYAGRIDASGAVLWTSDGVPVCTAANGQWSPVITSDGGGGALISWSDERDGSNNVDVYAQRVGPAGLIPTAVRTPPVEASVVMLGNAPNPFSSTTLIDLFVARASIVDVRVYDVRGRLVRRIMRGAVAAGSHHLQFDGRDESGRALASGVYFCTAVADDNHTVRKMVLER